VNRGEVAASGFADHIDNVAIVADRSSFAVDLGPGTP